LKNSPFTNFPKTSAGKIFDDDWPFATFLTFKAKAESE